MAPRSQNEARRGGVLRQKSTRVRAARIAATTSLAREREPVIRKRTWKRLSFPRQAERVLPQPSKRELARRRVGEDGEADHDCRSCQEPRGYISSPDRAQASARLS